MSAFLEQKEERTSPLSSRRPTPAYITVVAAAAELMAVYPVLARALSSTMAHRYQRVGL